MLIKLSREREAQDYELESLKVYTNFTDAGYTYFLSNRSERNVPFEIQLGFNSNPMVTIQLDSESYLGCEEDSSSNCIKMDGIDSKSVSRTVWCPAVNTSSLVKGWFYTGGFTYDNISILTTTNQSAMISFPFWNSFQSFSPVCYSIMRNTTPYSTPERTRISYPTIFKTIKVHPAWPPLSLPSTFENLARAGDDFSRDSIETLRRMISNFSAPGFDLQVCEQAVSEFTCRYFFPIWNETTKEAQVPCIDECLALASKCADLCCKKRKERKKYFFFKLLFFVPSD